MPEQPIELGRGVRRHYVPTLKWRLRRFWSRLPPESRFFKRSTYYRSARATAYGWTLAALIPVGLLGGLGYLIGRGTASLHWPQPWQALAVTAAKPAVAPFLAFLIALLIAWWCRLARLAWLTWKPGEIVVPDFEEGTDVAAGTAKQLTCVFRNRLAELRLQSAAPTPGAAQATDFVDVLDSSSVSSADTLKTVLTLLRAAFPSHAIEVQGMLRRRSVPGPDKYGVVVQAVFLQGQASRVLERWGISWECVLEQAADEITAEILPRTRACRGPWAAWRGYQMPTALIATYEDAAEHEEDGHYDAALDRYAAVLKLDPTNVEVRLRLAQLEEKLGLFLKALASYQSIQSLTHPGAKNLPRGLYRRGARREWERVVRIAQYRELALLGEGSIVGQWSRTKQGERLPGRERKALWKEFETHLRPLTTPRNDPVSDAISQGIVALLSAEKRLDKAAERELVLTLRRWAYQGFDALRRSLPMIVLHPGDEPLTRTTVGLSMACIRLRFDLLAAIVDPEYQPRVADASLPDLLNKQVAWAGGRPGPWTLEWAPPRLRRRWHDVYNAACLYAIPLNRPYAATLPDGVDEELAKRAVAYLERASACADSSFLQARRDWVLQRDHDLTGLRRRPEFETFVDVYFPDEAPPRWREGPRERLVESQYTRRLLVALGESFHETWHKRAHDAWEVHKVQGWYEEELRLWMLLADVAHRAFDWRLRIRLQNYATELLIRHDQAPPDVSFATPANGALITRPAANGRPRNKLRANRRRLSELDGLLRNDYGRNRTCFDNWLRLLRGYDADSRSSLSDTDLEDLCHHQAAVWQALADWMGGSTGGFGTFRQELREASASRTRMVAKVNGR